MSGFSDAWDAIKFIGKAGAGVIRTGNPLRGSKLSNLISTDKIRDQWNKNKNTIALTGATAGIGQALAAKTAAAPIIAKATPVITKATPAIVTAAGQGGTAGTAAGSTAGATAKSVFMKNVLPAIISKGLESGQNQEAEEDNQNQVWNDYMNRNRDSREQRRMRDLGLRR